MLWPALLASPQALLADKASDVQERVRDLLNNGGAGLCETVKEKPGGKAESQTPD
jgi:hypothetical protein